MRNCVCIRCSRHLAILGLDPTASYADLIVAHRDLVKVWHPDRFELDQRLRSKAEEQFKLIQEAFTGLQEHEAQPALKPEPPTTSASYQAQSVPEEPPLYAISIAKLALLNIFSLGYFQYYWFYRNWRALKKLSNAPIWPLPRALFSVWYCWPCFVSITNRGEGRGIPGRPLSSILAILWIAFYVAPWWLGDNWWMLTVVSTVFLLPVQAYANRINVSEAPSHNPNARFTAWVWLTIAFGTVAWLLILLELFVFMPARAKGLIK